MMRLVTLGLLASASLVALVCCESAADDDATTTTTADAGAPSTTAGDASPGVTSPAPDGAAPSDAGVRDRCSAEGWCKEPLPTDDFDLAAVWTFGPDDAWAAGATGLVRWDGKTWSRVDPGDAGLFDGITRLVATGPNDLWAVAQGSRALLHGTRSAAGQAFSWGRSERDGGPSRDLLTNAGASDLWLAGRSEDDGTTSLEHVVVNDGGVLTSKTIAPPAADGMLFVNGLYASAKDEVWIAANVNGGRVYRGAAIPDGGFAWDESLATNPDTFTDLPALWGSGAKDLWVLASRSEHYHRGALPDGGAAWTASPNHATTTLTSIWGSGPNDVWAVGYFGAIRHFDGTTWKVAQTSVNGLPIYANLFAVHGSAPDDVWAVGPGITLHRTSRTK